MTEDNPSGLSIYIQAAIAMMLIQLVHKIVREIPGAFRTVSGAGGVGTIVFTCIIATGIILLLLDIKWGLVFGLIDGAWMLFQPILVHGILAKPDINCIWWYPVFPMTQAALIIYFCMLAWKQRAQGLTELFPTNSTRS